MADNDAKKERFKTGQEASVSGVYRLVGTDHDGEVNETNTEHNEDKEIPLPLSRGERFPPHRHCKEAIEWEFIRPA